MKKMMLFIVVVTLLSITLFAQARMDGGNKVYKVGDIGPAGGYIFYVKRASSDGWRYLEVAPENAELEAKWGADEYDVTGTEPKIGAGKKNTQLIVAKLTQLGEHDSAAQRCDDLVVNGFDDWFLPSRDELLALYKKSKDSRLERMFSRNFKPNRVGMFAGTGYWSSSQHSATGAWYQNFSGNGQKDVCFKDSTYKVRAIRAF